MSGVFDISKPGVGVTSSSFGGGWAWPLDAAGTQALHEFFGEAPGPIPMMRMDENGESVATGYIVEPWQSADLAEHLRSCNVAWKVI